ncbi:NSFL1 cofactor p47 [Anthonomus grandis grandis]|uniref:NSFL1 cofactor p47 n=1 Tax=Anthonomus grandis grandis TaxID=2921223 RepID=UPI00216667EA|nr:NSFL1 cofactor p47 [Anthonomus grandis grandis]
MSDQEDKVQQFIGITGANPDRAKFFLESAAWNVEVAMSRYYENGGDDVELVEESPIAPPETPSPVVTPIRPKPKKSSNFATLNTLATSSDEEEEGQAYYAGGSEHSGQQVLGPPKKRDIVADMFKSVQEHGVEILDSSTGASGSGQHFRGTGYKLGHDETSSETVPGYQAPAEPQEVTLKLWQNGFSVNDGELREYADPANAEFLGSIRRGEIPPELRRGRAEIHLAMEDHREEQYKPPKVRSKPFQGHGYTLGSPAPVIVGSCSEEDKEANEARAKEQLKVNPAEPTTSLQIRLADGTRLVGQFNHGHTVGQIREYITIARPQYQTQSFNLLSTYPSKVLEDSVSLKDAGLLNAAIMQKLT